MPIYKYKYAAYISGGLALLCICISIYIALRHHRWRSTELVHSVHLDTPLRQHSPLPQIPQRPQIPKLTKLSKLVEPKSPEPSTLTLPEESPDSADSIDADMPTVGDIHISQLYTSNAVTILPSDRLEVPAAPIRQRDEVCDANLHRALRYWKVNLTSEARDHVQWPNVSMWRTQLPTILRNVSSVTVQSAAIYGSEYTIDAWNDSLDILIGGTSYTVTVPSGNYSAPDLVTAVTSAIVATDAALANLSLVYNVLDDTVTFVESTPTLFTLLWWSGYGRNTSLWKTLGFSRLDTDAELVGGQYASTGQGRVDLVGVLAVDVFVDELDNALDNGPVGRINLIHAVTTDSPVFMTSPFDTHMFWPIGRLTHLTLRFMVQYAHIDTSGNVTIAHRPYMFHRRNCTLRLAVGCTTYINPLLREVELDPGTT